MTKDEAPSESPRSSSSGINLRIPGPTPCLPEVLAATGQPMMNYRGPEMRELLDGLRDKLGRYLKTDRESLLLTTSGTGGLEAAIVNLLSPGDRVVGVSAGVFGERFCAIAESYGAQVSRLEVEWGKAAHPDALRDRLRSERDVRAVLLTHNETSTGIAHPIEALCRVAREESDGWLLVDAISSLGAMPLAMDDLDIDVVVTGSQKAWGAPPGMSLLFPSAAAFRAAELSTMPRFLLDFRRYREAHARGTFPFTPSLPVVYALDRALDFLVHEGLARVYQRHERVADTARNGLAALGLTLYADALHLSPTVTAVRVPAEVREDDLVELLRTRYQTVVARGQERLRGEILRIGHLGFVQPNDVEAAVYALGRAIGDLIET